MKALIPGSFDPVTLGHLDIIARTARLFSDVVVAVSVNPDKKTMFTAEQRVRMLSMACVHLRNVSVLVCGGLVGEFCRENSVDVIVKGLRDTRDYEYENEMAEVNRRICETAETLFMPCDDRLRYISSNMVRIFINNGREVDEYLPDGIGRYIKSLLP